MPGRVGIVWSVARAGAWMERKDGRKQGIGEGRTESVFHFVVRFVWGFLLFFFCCCFLLGFVVKSRKR